MQTHYHWQTLASSGSLTLPNHEVHVWRTNLNTSPAHLQSLQRALSSDELERANRFHFAQHRHHFIVARGTLRTLLSRYLNTSPKELHFQYNVYGKPALDFPATRLHFNLSHSHELALFAFSYNREIGVDIEYMSRDIEYNELAQHTFSLQEATTITALSGEAKREGFFNCWTRKEAYIKARGMGVSLDLACFDVSLRPGDPVTLLQSRENPHEVTRWRFEALNAGEDYKAAIAVEGHDWQLRTWQFSGA